MVYTDRIIVDASIQKLNQKQGEQKRFVENIQKSTKRFVVFHKGITKYFVEYYNISAMH